jgi:hypothetical protein
VLIVSGKTRQAPHEAGREVTFGQRHLAESELKSIAAVSGMQVAALLRVRDMKVKDWATYRPVEEIRA